MDYRDIEAGATEDFCWFKAKLELIDILLAKAGIKNSAKILSAGCGIGREMEIIKEYGDIYAIDVDPGIIASLPDGLCIEKRVCDVCDTSLYPDNFFDAVVAFDLLEHCKDDTPAIKEIHRALKPNGLFVFTVSQRFNPFSAGMIGLLVITGDTIEGCSRNHFSNLSV